MQYLAALTTGADLTAWVLTVAGNLFAAVLAVRAVGAFMKRDWGEMITMFAAAVIVAGIIYFPSQATDILKLIWGKVSGTSS
jgi:FtsH-binding integral membrane protein